MDVNALKAWSVETGDNDVLLAILDSGLEDDHYDEEGDEFYGRIGPTKNWKLPPLDDLYGHGTHTTGIAAAATNSGYGEGDEHGIAGVAGGWSEQGGVELAIGKIAETEEAYLFHIVAGIEWATDQQADVLNCSYGSNDITMALSDAIKNAFKADMTLFFASGNSGGSICYPAKLANTDFCCAVGAMNQYSQRWSNSSYGDELSFVAPGVHILSTYKDPDYYDSLSGTSTASPHVAGVGALLYSTNPNLMDVDCKRIMEHTARDISPSGWDQYTGYGCVDAWEALRHFYWPYTLEHRTIPNSQFQFEKVAEDIKVTFLGDMSDKISAGEYFGCTKYELTGHLSFTNAFEEAPWCWERMMSVPTGYVGESLNPNADITTGKFQIKTSNLTSTGVDFETHVYWVGHCYDVSGRKIELHKWVPYYLYDVEVAITALGRNATKTTHSPTIPSSSYGLHSDLAVDFIHPDVPNTVHISYYDIANGDLRYVIDNFNGFSSSEIVDSDGDVGAWSSIALDYEGMPHIAYYDITDHIPKHAKKSGSSWVIEPMWYEEGGVAAVYHTSIAVAEVPGLAVGLVQACGYLYHADPMPAPFEGYDLVYFRRDGSGPYGWSAEAVDIGGDVGDYCCIATGPDGTPHISYYDATNTNLKYAVRLGTNDWVTMTVDDDIGNVGKYTSIAVDKLGGVHISYYDQTNDALKYAYRSPGGGSWQIETAYEYLGQGTSICIDDDGLPVIVFGSSSIACAKRLTSGWDIQPVDGSGDAHYGTSVGIDNLGRVVATYYKDNKLYVSRRMRWEQNPGGNMAASSAGVGEELKPSNPMEPDITEITPNPTTGSATIHYQLPHATDIRIAVYDVSGQKVATLLSGEQSAGMHELTWKGYDEVGRQVSNGVYFIRMETENHQVRKKITLIR